MRTTWCLVILAAGLVLAGDLRLSECGAAGGRVARKAKTKAAPPRRVQQEEDVVDGYGATAASARARAVERAQLKVEELLVQRFGEAGWKPSAEQLDPEYLKRYEVITEVGEPEATTEVDGDKALLAR